LQYQQLNRVLARSKCLTSLKPLLSSPYFSGLRSELKVRVLDAYWTGIRALLRPAFDDPDNYALQKGIGVAVMHTILPHVIECIRDLGLLPTDGDAYTRVLGEALSKIQGENSSGEPVSGLDFWASAPRGAANSYSSSAGKRVLGAKLRQLLPEIPGALLVSSVLKIEFDQLHPRTGIPIKDRCKSVTSRGLREQKKNGKDARTFSGQMSVCKE